MRPLLLIAVPLLALAGCGGGGHVDAGHLETLIKNRFAIVEGVPVRSVQCPGDVPVRTGRTFTCRTGVRGDAPIEVVVTERGKDAFTIVPALSADRVERLLTRRGFGTSRVSVLGAKCPNGVAYRLGGTLQCQVALAGGEKVPVLVRQTDNRGAVSFSAIAIVATAVEGDIARRLRVHGNAPQVTCPRGIAIVPGRRFACLAHDGATRNVAVVVLNRRGDVRFRVTG
jgi:hypothetical protein